MLRRTIFSFLAAAVVTLASASTNAQTTLSHNSGINSADTWATFDLTIQSQNLSENLPVAVYNPATQAASNTLAVTTPAQVFHVEVGYDAGGGTIMNMWPGGTASDPLATATSSVGVLRVAGGQLAFFDRNNNPLAVPMPNTAMPANWPFNLLGSNPGPSVISSLVVPNIQAHATAMAAGLTIASSPATATLSVPLSKGGVATWNYSQSGINWVAQQMTMPVSTSSLKSSITVQFANVHWSDNSTKDAARAAAGSTAQAPPAPTTNTPPTPATPPLDAAATPEPSIVQPIQADCTYTVAPNYKQVGSQNVLLQHGIWSNGCAWTRMANWLNQDFLISNEIIPSWNANASLESQGKSLVNAITAQGGKSYILLGHSQGGLVSRWAAQQLQLQVPAPVEGVVTVDTPHTGANIAFNAPLTVASILETYGVTGFWDMGCYSEWDNFGCYVADLEFFVGASAIPALYTDAGSISFSELAPGSGFLNTLNKGTESFQQAAIVGKTPQHFAVARVLTNFLSGLVCGSLTPCCNPEDTCGERSIASLADDFEYAVAGAYIFAIIEEYASCDGSGDCFYADLAQGLLNVLIGMEFVDLSFDALIDFPGDGSSDAIVQGPSQYYPPQYKNAVNYVISGADSHTGALRSSYVHSYLDTALSQMKVPTASSCQYSVSNSPDSVSGNAVTGSFNLTAASACQWSAVSQSPWISITSGVNGIASGTISYAIDANPTTMSRVGYIQAGNGFSNTLFTVNQAGSCLFTLSEGPTVASPAPGTSSTVQVTSVLNCPWSAVSNANWLTITTGATSTGSGSFTWSAAANTTSVNRIGTITVAGQVLTVMDGSDGGTPGKGSFTISGSPQSYTFTPCPPAEGPCTVTVSESGYVFVIINGQSFSSGYGGTLTAQYIASTLAQQINAAGPTSVSPVTATANGAVVSIQSTIDGTATNYMLSNSATFNPSCNIVNGTNYCFTTPAFVAVPSGMQMTGGTD